MDRDHLKISREFLSRGECIFAIHGNDKPMESDRMCNLKFSC